MAALSKPRGHVASKGVEWQLPGAHNVAWFVRLSVVLAVCECARFEGESLSCEGAKIRGAGGRAWAAGSTSSAPSSHVGAGSAPVVFDEELSHSGLSPQDGRSCAATGSLSDAAKTHSVADKTVSRGHMAPGC
jgi:hypothetical protein